MTTYIVLQRKRDDDPTETGWEPIGEVDATSANAAVRKAVTEGGTYVAVPARSWRPVTVEAVQTTILKLS